MGKDTKSETKREQYVEEKIASDMFGGRDHHYVTTIRDGKKEYSYRDNTSEGSQKGASEKRDRDR